MFRNLCGRVLDGAFERRFRALQPARKERYAGGIETLAGKRRNRIAQAGPRKAGVAVGRVIREFESRLPQRGNEFELLKVRGTGVPEGAGPAPALARMEAVRLLACRKAPLFHSLDLCA